MFLKNLLHQQLERCCKIPVLSSKLEPLLDFLNFFPQLTDAACVISSSGSKSVEGLSKLVGGFKGAISRGIFTMNINYGNFRQSDC